MNRKSRFHIPLHKPVAVYVYDNMHYKRSGNNERDQQLLT